MYQLVWNYFQRCTHIKHHAQLKKGHKVHDLYESLLIRLLIKSNVHSEWNELCRIGLIGLWSAQHKIIVSYSNSGMFRTALSLVGASQAPTVPFDHTESNMDQ